MSKRLRQKLIAILSALDAVTTILTIIEWYKTNSKELYSLSFLLLSFLSLLFLVYWPDNDQSSTKRGTKHADTLTTPPSNLSFLTAIVLLILPITIWFFSWQILKAEAPRLHFPDFTYSMLEDDSLKDVSCAKWGNAYFWNQEKFTREEIEEIHFVRDFPELNSSLFIWDVSANQDNTVQACVDTRTLYVLSDGRIAFPKNSAFLLAGFCNAKEITFENPVDTSNVETMERLFSDCNAVKELDLSSFDTSHVRNMAHMFAACKDLTELDLRTFDTSKVTDMECMFYECKNLGELNLSSFDTSSVDTMKQMFQSCENISVLDISSFDVSRVKYMTYMFSECGNLRSVELGKFNTSSLRDINAMFYNCHSLQEIDTSGWNLSGLINCTKTFEKCTSLKNIKADNWNFPENVRPIDFMDDGCTINIPWKDYFNQLH